MVRVTDAKYHWYDLLAGFARSRTCDPVGRYMRRMQFELDAAAEKRHLFFAVTRPRVRFDVTGVVQLLAQADAAAAGGGGRPGNHLGRTQGAVRGHHEKPTVILAEDFISLNWGGLVGFSVHDLLTSPHAQAAEQGPTSARPAIQTAASAKAACPPCTRCAQFGADYDILLLLVGMEVDVNCAEGDPAAQPHNEHPLAADALQAERMDVIEAALIRHFEGSTPRWRTSDERKMRSELDAVQACNQLAQYTIDLQLPETGFYNYLCSEFVTASRQHLLSCYIADGQAQVASCHGRTRQTH
jgi:hypothetical protein